MPGKIFPKFFFEMEIWSTSIFGSYACNTGVRILGVFLLTRNLALIGDGLAHVSFGGVALQLYSAYLSVVLALTLSIISAIIIMSYKLEKFYQVMLQLVFF